MALIQDFRQFVQSLLLVGGLNEQRAREFTSNECLITFRRSLTHKSYDRVDNYEYLEFFGDSVVNSSVALYLRRRFPTMVSTKWLVKMQHNLSSKLFLADQSEKIGFLKYARYGRSIEELLASKKDLSCDLDYVSMMEDFYEAFFAAVYLVIDEKSKFGVGSTVVANIMTTFLDRDNIQVDYREVFDARSRVKEIYDQYEVNFDQHNNTRPKGISRDGWYTSQVWWPLEGRNIQFKSARECTKTRSRNKAAEYAIEALSRRGIDDKLMQDPYSRVDKKEELTGERDLDREKYINDNIHEIVSSLLIRGNVRPDQIHLFVNKDTIPTYVEAFTDKSYPLKNDLSLYKVVGDPLSIFCTINFIKQRYPDIYTEKWLTRLRHKLMNKTIIGTIAHDYGFGRYILYGKSMKETIERIPDMSDNEEYLKMMKGIFESFLGAMVQIVDSVKGYGVGTNIAMNIISSFLNLVPISLDYADMFDPVSRLKEMFETSSRKWRFNENLKHSENTTEEGVKEHTFRVYGYPQGRDKILIGEATARTKKRAKNAASERALTLLKEKYRFHEIAPDWK